MEEIATRPVGLIVSDDATLAEHLLRELRALDWIAVTVDRCEVALEMMEAVDFSVVIVDVAGAEDWAVCRRLVESSRGAVAVVTDFLARDRRYRRSAFRMGVVAYASKAGARGRLREMLRRLRRGERGIELLAARGRRRTAAG